MYAMRYTPIGLDNPVTDYYTTRIARHRAWKAAKRLGYKPVKVEKHRGENNHG